MGFLDVLQQRHLGSVSLDPTPDSLSLNLCGDSRDLGRAALEQGFWCTLTFSIPLLRLVTQSNVPSRKSEIGPLGKPKPVSLLALLGAGQLAREASFVPEQQFSTGELQGFLQHAEPDSLVRATDFFFLRLSS